MTEEKMDTENSARREEVDAYETKLRKEAMKIDEISKVSGEGVVRELRRSITVRGFGKCRVIKYSTVN